LAGSVLGSPEEMRFKMPLCRLNAKNVCEFVTDVGVQLILFTWRIDAQFY